VNNGKGEELQENSQFSFALLFACSAFCLTRKRHRSVTLIYLRISYSSMERRNTTDTYFGSENTGSDNSAEVKAGKGTKMTDVKKKSEVELENVSSSAPDLIIQQTSDVDDGWSILRHSRAGILVMLVLSGAVASTLTYIFSEKIQDDSFILQVCKASSTCRLCVYFLLGSTQLLLHPGPHQCLGDYTGCSTSGEGSFWGRRYPGYNHSFFRRFIWYALAKENFSQLRKSCV
jgi:hypothetical protein